MRQDTQDYNTITKKERKMLKRQRKLEDQMRKEKRRLVRRFVFWALGFSTVLAIIFGAIVMFMQAPSDERASYGGIPAVAENEWIKGDISAPIILVEYSDFQCPACGSYYPIVKQLSKEYDQKVGFVYRHFPLKSIHKNAELAAMASEAAGLQGNFWGMHDMIFENQSEWSNARDAEEFFIDYAEFLGLDVPKFGSDLTSRAAKSEANKDYKDALKAGVNSTPTFFLNGNKIKNPRSYGEFKSLIEQTLQSISR